jgi:hypothetical protein
MDDRLLLGIWRTMLPIPRPIWQRLVHGGAQLDFMSADHHRVRNHVVRELPREGLPLPPASIARALDLPLARVNEILDELERHMTFLFRNSQGEVVWAYPVTAERTPHHVTLSTGERIYAA